MLQRRMLWVGVSEVKGHLRGDSSVDGGAAAGGGHQTESSKELLPQCSVTPSTDRHPDMCQECRM